MKLNLLLLQVFSAMDVGSLALLLICDRASESSNEECDRSVEVPEIEVRIHSAIVYAATWSKLWYLCRALDTNGKGHVVLEFDKVCNALDAKPSTVYEWMRCGRAASAFRSIRKRGKYLDIWLGSLVKVSQTLGLESWGTVATVPLSSLRTLRPIATAITTQQLQDQSRYAAWRSLNAKERKFYKLTPATEILAHVGRSSANPERGKVAPCVRWIGNKRLFVSKGFIPYGCSQEKIGNTIGRSSRTVRRHLQQLEIVRRQVVQSKWEYTLIDCGVGIGRGGGKLSDDYSYTLVGDDWWLPDSEIILNEPNGHTSSKRKYNIKKSRFFHYKGKTYIYRCNLYSLNYSLKTMKARKKSYKIQIAQKDSFEPTDNKQKLSTGRFRGVDGVSIFRGRPRKEGHNP